MKEDLNIICSGKSRFNQEIYQKVLKTQRQGDRGALSRKEKRYCKASCFWPESKLVRILALILLCVIGTSPFLLAGIFNLSAGTGFSLVLFVSVVLVGPMILFSFNARQKFKKRQDVNIEVFIKNSSELDNYDQETINIVRDTLGQIHKLRPNKIFPRDKLRFLCMSSKTLVPLQFEVILGVANRMGITLTESQVDHIGKMIYDEADSVEYLTIILLDEFHKIQTMG